MNLVVQVHVGWRTAPSAGYLLKGEESSHLFLAQDFIYPIILRVLGIEEHFVNNVFGVLCSQAITHARAAQISANTEPKSKT